MARSLLARRSIPTGSVLRSSASVAVWSARWPRDVAFRPMIPSRRWLGSPPPGPGCCGERGAGASAPAWRCLRRRLSPRARRSARSTSAGRPGPRSGTSLPGRLPGRGSPARPVRPSPAGPTTTSTLPRSPSTGTAPGEARATCWSWPLATAGRVPSRQTAVLDQAIETLRQEYAADPAVRAAAAELIERLGLGLAGLVNVLNPDRILLGGLHRYLLEADPARLRAAVAERSPWGRGAGVPLLACVLDEGSLIGAAELAWQPVLDNPAVLNAG